MKPTGRIVRMQVKAPSGEWFDLPVNMIPVIARGTEMIDHTEECQILETGKCTCKQDLRFRYDYGHVCGPGCPWYDAGNRPTLEEIDEGTEND